MYSIAQNAFSKFPFSILLTHFKYNNIEDQDLPTVCSLHVHLSLEANAFNTLVVTCWISRPELSLQIVKHQNSSRCLIGTEKKNPPSPEIGAPVPYPLIRVKKQRVLNHVTMGPGKLYIYIYIY